MHTITSAFRRLSLISSAIAALFASTASAQLILNGSFESQTSGTSTTATTTPNSATFSNWFVATSSGTTLFQIADTTGDTGLFPDAINGSLYMAINGSNSTAGVGLIYQDFATTPGYEYEVSFTAGRGSVGTGLIGIKGDVFNVISGATSGGSLGTATSSSSTSGSRFYAGSTFNFTASGSTSRLIFADISSSTGSTDALLDNVSVSVSAVPEPASSAALAGAALLGLAALRRRRRAKA